jgi:polar amino acid transport system permease protein
VATSDVGAGETRPPAQRPEGRMEGLAQWSARIPFRAKVAVVWIVIFILLGIFFNLSKFDTSWMKERADFIFFGIRFTIQIGLMGIILAVILATFGALGRLSRNPVAYGVSGFYTSFFRGTPLIVQMFLIAFALPQIIQNLGLPSGVKSALTFQPQVAGVLALGLNYGAYMTEIFRAGIQSVGHGQGEAADALGMTYRKKMRRVVLPQAFRVIIPPTGNEFIAMMKDTALVGFLGIAADQAEIFRRASLAGTADFRPMEAYLLAALMYWGLTAIFTFFQSRLERRIGRGYVRGSVGPDKKTKVVSMSGSGQGGTMPVVTEEDIGGGPELGGQGH